MKNSIEYKIGQYRISINFWFLIIFLLLQTGLNELGFWQISRAEQKIERLKKIERQDLVTVTDLDLVDSNFIANFGPVSLELELKERFNLLIENKIQDGKLGYHVLNLVTEKQSGRTLLVNRGWIAAKADRSNLPKVKLPPNYWSSQARVYPINPDILSTDAELEEYPRIIRLPVLDTHILGLLEKQLGYSIEPYLLRVDPESAAALDVDWMWVSMSPDKHLGYAFQWFGLAFAFMIVSLFAAVKKEPKKSS